MPETRQPHIETALTLLDRERRYTNAERSAFERFRARVAEVEPALSATRGGVGDAAGDAMVRAATSAPPDSAARSVRAAYRETVCSVQHFEAEYDETPAAHFAAELGADVAAQIFGGGRLTPPVHDTLLAGVDKAIEDRETYLKTLRTERASLREIRDRLDDCEARTVELGSQITNTDSAERSAIDEQLQALEATCTDLAASRQELLHGRSTAQLVGISGESLVQFLYADCEATCPALADIADCIETIRRHRERCLQ